MPLLCIFRRHVIGWSLFGNEYVDESRKCSLDTSHKPMRISSIPETTEKHQLGVIRCDHSMHEKAICLCNPCEMEMWIKLQ